MVVFVSEFLLAGRWLELQFCRGTWLQCSVCLWGWRFVAGPQSLGAAATLHVEEYHTAESWDGILTRFQSVSWVSRSHLDIGCHVRAYIYCHRPPCLYLLPQAAVPLLLPQAAVPLLLPQAAVPIFIATCRRAFIIATGRRAYIYCHRPPCLYHCRFLLLNRDLCFLSGVCQPVGIQVQSTDMHRKCVTGKHICAGEPSTHRLEHS